MAIPSFSSTVVARAAAALYGLQLGNGTMTSVLAEANLSGGVDSLINSVYYRDYGSVSNQDVAAMIVANLGITGDGAQGAVDYLKYKLDTAPAGKEGVEISNALTLFAGMTGDPVYGAAASAFNGRVATAVAYAQQAGTTDRGLYQGAAISFTLGQDFLSGTPGNDTVTARIVDNSNTMQSGDVVDGGAGNDRVEADMGTSQAFAVTPEFTNVETVAIRGQARASDSGDNNVVTPGVAKVDAERIVGATQFESNNSRADVIVEDVRILGSQITKDITVAFVESDPGHVDFGLYFDQYSLKNQVSNTSSINLQIMDTVAAAAGKAPLLNSNYGAFTFTITPPGAAPRVVTLASDAIQDAQTYEEMAAAFQAELDREFGAGVATATLGANFTVVDPASRIAVTGRNIVLTTKTATTFSTPAGSGWSASGVAPPSSNFYTNFNTDATVSNSLVTSTVVLDDVGRGSTSGDLVIGGLSVGSTSSSLGVQRFEIEVRDNSKLESINSTNNTLREVTVVNGLTSSTDYAYGKTVKDAGNLTVNGNSGLNGQNISGFSNRVAVGTGSDAATGVNTPLPGVQSTSSTGAVIQGSAAIQTYGFTDVRLIDASALKGKFEFTAQVTSSSLAKYLNLKDIQALPAGDNIAFTYTGGANDDTMFVRLDSNFAASRNTIMVGREDFTFTANGGAGNDWINVALTPAPGGDQAWYTNQKLNKNITLDGGAGDDVIRKPGAGDFTIIGGTGNDTVYADNSGAQVTAVGTSSLAGQVYTTAEAAELAAALALAQLANTTNDSGALAPQLGFGNPNPLAQPDATVAALNTLDLVTPVTFVSVADATVPLALDRGTLKTAIDTAYAAGALTVTQQAALYTAIGVTGGTITPATLAAAPDITGEVVPAGNITAAEFAAFNSALAPLVTAAQAAAATADAADLSLASQATLLNATQLAVINAQLAVNAVAGPEAPQVIGGITLSGANGTAVTLAGLTTLRSAINVGTTDAAARAAIVAARDAEIIDGATATSLLAAAVAGAAGVDAAELFAVQVILEPIIAAATVANTTATAALAAAIAANDAAVRAAAAAAGADPLNAGQTLPLVLDATAIGANEAALAATAAQAALTAFNNGTLNPALDTQAALAALKAAIAVGVSDLNVTLLTAAAVAAGTIAPADKAAIDTAAGAGTVEIADTVNQTEKNAVDVLIQALQEVSNATVAVAQAQAATLTAVRDATAFAAAQAAAAAVASPGAGFAEAPNKAVWVLNTANQKDVTTALGTGYVLAVNDERNVADLKSDANNNYNFFATKLTVTFKDLTATVDVPNTGFKTSDLQINQAIKDAINNNAVLNKLLSATDGPANTLVITSLIDGKMSNANLDITLKLPDLAGLAGTDVAGAAAAYGVDATSAAVLAAMTTAKTSYDAKGDYVDQLAETGAFGGNVEVTGAPSTTTSDNIITPGDGNDVTVLGTTADTTTPFDALLSSNDRVVFGAAFGNDTIVHFKAGALASGGDILALGVLGGTVFGNVFNVNNSVNVANEVAATNGTATLVAGLFADSATAQTHVYVAVDPLTNIGKVYSVVDAAGVGTGSVTATLAGTIDLADTLWSTLTAENFG